jgi:Uma2 family endonuclease
MQVVLPEDTESVKLVFEPVRMLDDDEYYAFCMSNPDLRIERTAKGEVVVVAPVGGESSFQSGEVFGELRAWARREKRGKALESSAEFILPTGAALSPDASWVSFARLSKLSKDQRKKFLKLCPEFIIEVMSPSDRLNTAKAKMNDWMAGGVDLGWLIDGEHQTVYIYRAGQPEPEKRKGVNAIEGEGPVAGFALDLTEIWAGL